ncbi:hypothetical protein [Streptomonospora wellingtoniae]|uniref:MinD-like ATPase involved in chromosome partitioning or flagellar assembly n=1 Tax=Streptomonospora wellingtoniae TaxID=3075544 RepID=A0ABU2KWD5_9ACTN|nr:hypothetical protein [Streptomonospora sp. DSM 45055]MDT0303616.1 hypothetical protein [Streptomonospora sp. DSM 45055]
MGRTVALFSLGGAPGVSVTALALAAVWPDPAGAVLVEADASGGDVAAWHRLQPSPGVTDLAAATRHRGAGPQADPAAYSQTLPGGLSVCPGPASADPAGGAVQLLATNNPALTAAPADPPAADAAGQRPAVLADLGRLAPRTPTAHIAAHAGEALLIVADDTAQLRRVQQSAAPLAESVERLRVVVAGGSGSTDEFGSALGLPVWSGRIPLDRQSAAFLRGEAHLRRPARRPLFKAALALARTVAAPDAAAPQPPPPQPRAQRYAAAEPPSGARGPDTQP